MDKLRKAAQDAAEASRVIKEAAAGQAAIAQAAQDTAALGQLVEEATRFQRYLRAGRKSVKTQETYGEATSQLHAFLTERGMPTAVENIRREHVESFVLHLAEERKLAPATVSNRFRALQSFWKFLVEDDVIPVSPMAKMSRPKIPETPPTVLSEDQLKALIAACKGSRFEDRRDEAIIRMFVATGARVSELAGPPEEDDETRFGLTVDDIDLDAGIVRLVGKAASDSGPRERPARIGDATIRALDRYQRVRERHPRRRSRGYFVGPRGSMTDSGIRSIVRKRGERAGLGHIHPHQLRHTFAHRFLSKGGNESDLMRIMGWRSRAMVLRYGASAATERALDSAARLRLDEF